MTDRLIRPLVWYRLLALLVLAQVWGLADWAPWDPLALLLVSAALFSDLRED